MIERVAGDPWPPCFTVLPLGRRQAVAGAIAGPMVELDARTLYLNNLRGFGCTVLGPEVFKI